MKPPEDIWDRSPLEQEPFLSSFQVRRFAGSRRGDNWFARLAKEIQKDSSQRPAAVQWSKLAFATEPEGKTSRTSNARPSPKELSVFIEVFVRFYWALFNDDDEGALNFLNGERRKRHCGYQAKLPRKEPRATHQAGGTSQPPHPNNASNGPAPEPWRSGGSRGTRRGRGPRGGILGEAEAATDKSKDAADGPHGAAVVGGTGGNKEAPWQSGDSEQAAEMVPIVAETLGPSSDVAICDAHAAMDVPEEDKGVVVFRGDTDVAAFVDNHSHPHAGESLTSPPREEEVSDNHEAMEASPAPTAVSRTTPSDISGTTAVEVTDQDAETTEVSAKPRKPRWKKARKEASQQPSRQRQPRAASNQERLSQLAKGELEYHSKVKRGLADDLEDLIPTPGDRQQSATAPPTRRTKKSKLRAPSEDRDDPMSPSEAGGRTDPTSESVSAPLPSRSQDIPEASNDAKRSRRKKRHASRKERKIPGVDPSIRPSKRQRLKESEANPTGALDDTTPQEERRTKKHTTAYTQVDGDPPAPSPATVPPGHGNGPDTAPSQPFTEGVTSSETYPEVSPARTIAKLPRLPSVRPGLPGLGAPSSRPARLGIPATLVEMDGIISGAAKDAEVRLKNTEINIDEWTPDLEAQDAPPDSDDEEEIPLCQVVSSRREVQDTAASPSVCESDLEEHKEEPLNLDIMLVSADQCTLPDASPPSPPGPSSPTVANASPALLPLPASTSPLSLACVQAGSPPPVTQNLVGTRVPRPVPPPVPQKKPLTARPTIWAKSRQEVCESFDWFRSYQSGVYHANDLVKGYLLSAFSASRDLFARDGRLIISHGGGKAESMHSAKGQATLLKASDQEEGDKSVRALLRTYKMGRPVALLIDDRYALFPYDLSSKPDCTYVVLGFYHIAHAWAERQPADNNIGFVVRYKFAFEWCDKQPEPWWVKQDESASLETCSIPAP
ncbi:hypothetical protein GSI_01562 [Ganoderma sinense ZZ0214-1]|uniref:Uncharacterized protein n=1 Tax=Ganoderma sinense ZZ0214-1 TaxID=1077348 RepID=A0A2G8SQ79_9APHY|nr:hypothetical protein GSI_01562 [Ganoderma sinense ZZ0214-1]